MDPFFPTALFISYLICEILNNLHLRFTLIHNKKLQADFTILNLNRLKIQLNLDFMWKRGHHAPHPWLLSEGKVQLIPWQKTFRGRWLFFYEKPKYILCSTFVA